MMALVVDRILLFILITFYICTVECLVESRIPQVFNDGLLLATPTEGVKDYVHLGRIFKLSTIFQPRIVATKFSIYNRRNQVEDITFSPTHYCYPDTCHGPFQFNLEALAKSGFDPKLRTIIMVPGFLTTDRPEFILRAKDLWLQLEDVNFIMVTWADGNRYMYSGAVANTPVVARQISIFLYYLAKLHGASIYDQAFLTRIQLIGHSLGAHISGFVGKEFGGRLGRITGLDPAGPNFKNFERSRRLDKRDALLVTVIHSNRGDMNYARVVSGGLKDVQGKYLKSSKEASIKKENVSPDSGNTVQDVIDDTILEFNNPWFGINQQVGDLDYYANDGAEQPGCKDFLHICDHGRSTELYLDLLSFELSGRNRGSSGDWRRESRILAFSSESYEDFIVGSNFNFKCPAILERKESTALGKVSLESFERCSVPLDVVSPVEKVIAELKVQHHIDLDKERYDPSTKFWFKTHGSAPFMGDHYLLKLEVGKGSSWDETCGLKGEIIMGDNSKVSLDSIKGVQLVSSDSFHGLAIPFINPIGLEATSARYNILKRTRSAGKKREFPDISQSLIKVVPSEVKLSITTSDLNKLLLTDSENRRDCSLNITRMEVEPVIGMKRNLAALYTDPSLASSPKRRARGFFRGSNKKLKRKISCDNCDPRILSVSNNPTITKKFSKLLIKKL